MERPISIHVDGKCLHTEDEAWESMGALHRAVTEQDTKRVKSLLRNGADPNAKDICGSDPLYFAVYVKRYDICLMLIQNGAKINSSNMDGLTALHIVAYRYNASIMRLLIERGGNVSVKDYWGATPLDGAKRHKNYEAIAMLQSITKKKNI